jgi:serine/threonine protein kinase
MPKEPGMNRTNYWIAGLLLLGGIGSLLYREEHGAPLSTGLQLASLLFLALILLLVVAARIRNLGLPLWGTGIAVFLAVASPLLALILFVILGILDRDQVSALWGRKGSPSPLGSMAFSPPPLSEGAGPFPASRQAPSSKPSPLSGPDFREADRVVCEGRHLGPGSTLYGYQVVRLLGEGGFGLTYLALDQQVGQRVVLKEYFPEELAQRSPDGRVHPRREERRNFQQALEGFREEAKVLARFHHPAIVRILSFFEANGTAYIVMEYLEGEDLDHYLRRRGRMRTAPEILEIVMPILEGLKEVHRYHYLHRDIKPSNILLCPHRLPTLIDFGASRSVVRKKTKLTTILTAGYAPIEQYGGSIDKQGPWTDIYAVAAVIYRMVTGEAPIDAQQRSYELLQEGRDPYRPLDPSYRERIGQGFARAVDRALSLKATDRPQSVEIFQKELVEGV